MDEVIENFPALLNTSGIMLPVGLLSNDETGSEDAELPENFEFIGEIKLEGSPIRLLLERVEAPDGGKSWLVSQTTIVALSQLSDQKVVPKINQVLPEFLLNKLWLGAPVGQWLVMPFIALGSMILGWLLSRGLSAFGRKYKQNSIASKRANVLLAASAPLGIVSAVIFFVFTERFLGISIVIRQDFGIFTVSLLWVALFIFIWSLLDRLSQHGESVLRQGNRVSSLSLIIFFRASAKAILVMLAIIIVLDSNGVDVTTGLAALGIGGIALALGAQKTIENVVGSVTLIVDQPFRVGDFCRVGDLMGTIENVGLRSTRIRTRADTLVNFPNGALSTQRIENFTLRRKFLLHTTLNLRYETETQNMERLLVALRKMLMEERCVDSDGLRVRFVGYGASSLDVEIFAYIRAANYEDFQEKQESILLRVSHVVESNGSGFAFPSRTLYIATDRAKASEIGD